ncbi:MAG: hypothetical protein L6R45_29660 [Anaerolineae bacterium]|nr:hypothetical protein [Anaerolineae bacterium]
MKTKKQKWTTSQKLQFAAFLVSATRFMSMGAMALGVDLVRQYWPFFWLELLSWLGFAILEGFAIPYISKGSRKFAAGTVERRQLTLYRLILLLAIPLLGAPYYVAVSNQLLLKDVLWPVAYWLWAFLFAGVGALIIDAVGTVEEANEPENKSQEEAKNQPHDQRAAVLSILATHGPLDPGALAELANVPVEVAARELNSLANTFGVNGKTAWRSANGIRARRPDPSPSLPSPRGRGVGGEGNNGHNPEEGVI